MSEKSKAMNTLVKQIKSDSFSCSVELNYCHNVIQGVVEQVDHVHQKVTQLQNMIGM